MPQNEIGKILILVGLLSIAIGGILIISQKIPFLGKLPGDIFYKKNNFSFYFPLMTSILISVLLTFIINFIGWKK